MPTSSSGWSRLRWPIKAIIIAAPLVAFGYFVIEKDIFNSEPESFQDNPGQVSETRNSADDKPATTTKNTTGELRTFNFEPEKPVNGELKGIVEVGATGFNSFVINMDKEKRWEIKSKDFGQSLVYEGLATTDDIRSGLKKYIAAMFDKGVKSKNVHFIISSGAQKEPKTTIISSELKKMGFVVNLVTPEQEGKLALKSVLPASYNESAFVTDIGSGNTKISWISGNGTTAVETPGAKYYEKELKDEDVFDQVKSKAAQVPANKREVCFIIGGVPFEMANQHRQGNERYTILKAPSSYNGDKPKMKSGLNIYNAITDATGCDTFVFDWDANFSIGFLLGLP